MPTLIRLVGRKIGRLRVLQRVVSKKRRPQYRCQCDCGKRLTVSHERLIHKRTPKTHCGCENQGIATKYKIEYHTWWDMIQRCHNEEHHGFQRYGAKGIQVCSRWRESFENFLADMGRRPKDHSIDRIDPNSGYNPENVRWATAKQQARNKRDTQYVKHPKTGKPTTVGELADEMGLTYHQMRYRLTKQGLL